MAAAVAGDLGWNEIPLALRLVKTCQIARGCGTLCTPPSAVFHSAFIGGILCQRSRHWDTEKTGQTHSLTLRNPRSSGKRQTIKGKLMSDDREIKNKQTCKKRVLGVLGHCF